MEGTQMGVARRIAELYEIKMNAVLDRAEDPREMVDYSYAQLQELLAEVHRGTAGIAAGRKRAEMQISQLQRSADRLQEQAEQAVATGREDLARTGAGPAHGDPQPGCRSARPAGRAARGRRQAIGRRAAAAGEDRGVPDPEGNDQSRLHRGAGRGEHRPGVHRDLGRDGQRERGGPPHGRQNG
jgi:hypothetical protein